MENVKTIEYLSDNERDVMVAACKATENTSYAYPYQIIIEAAKQLQELRKTARLQIVEPTLGKAEELQSITRERAFDLVSKFSVTDKGESFLKIPLNYNPVNREWVFRVTYKELKDLAYYLTIARIKDQCPFTATYY